MASFRMVKVIHKTVEKCVENPAKISTVVPSGKSVTAKMVDNDPLIQKFYTVIQLFFNSKNINIEIYSMIF